MKKILIITLVLMFVGTFPVFAHVEAHGHEDVKLLEDEIFGVKADAPNLVRINENLTLGGEVSKDLVNTAADEGWSYYAKVTYTGTIFDLSD